MTKTKSPVITKQWNPVLPAPAPLRVPLPSGDSVTFEFAGELPAGRAYTGYGYAIIVSADNTKHGRLLHFSISHNNFLPPWELISAVKRTLFPADVAAVMHLPELDSYINEHEFCLHVWQLPVQWGVL
jgi:hypothetical protein